MPRFVEAGDRTIYEAPHPALSAPPPSPCRRDTSRLRVVSAAPPDGEKWYTHPGGKEEVRFTRTGFSDTCDARARAEGFPSGGGSHCLIDCCYLLRATHSSAVLWNKRARYSLLGTVGKSFPSALRRFARTRTTNGPHTVERTQQRTPDIYSVSVRVHHPVLRATHASFCKMQRMPALPLAGDGEAIGVTRD